MRTLVSRVTALAAVAVALAAAPAPAAAQEFVVIVNAANPVSSLTRGEVSKLFLRKVDHWQNGESVLPVDLAQGQPTRESFTKQVHGKSVNAVLAYWQQQIFSGRSMPPVEKPSDEEVAAYVRANPDAIGYVSAAYRLGGGVKAVTVTN